MPVQIVVTSTHERAVRKLLSIEQRQAMEAAICADPLGAPIIPGSGGIRKVRWATSGRGKRGGLRVIYFFHVSPPVVYLLTAYAKSELEDLKPGDLRAWARLVATIKKEVR
jgi:hypothetical protein